MGGQIVARGIPISILMRKRKRVCVERLSRRFEKVWWKALWRQQDETATQQQGLLDSDCGGYINICGSKCLAEHDFDDKY